MFTSTLKLDTIQKLIKFHFFVFVLSLFLFTDVFLITFGSLGIVNISSAWKENVSALGVVSYLFTAGFFYAIFVPACILIYNLIIINIKKTYDIPSLKDGYFSIELLKKYSLVENVSPAYAEYQRLAENWREERFTDLGCFSLVILLLLDWIVSDSTNTSLVVYYYNYFETTNWLAGNIVRLVMIFFVFSICAIAFRTDRTQGGYEYDTEIAKKLLLWSKESTKRERIEKAKLDFSEG